MRTSQPGAAGSRAPAGSLSFCSIATPSHLGLAAACLSGIREQQPEADCVLLLLDDAAPPALPPGIRPLRLEDCAGPKQLKEMRERYSVAELCFALKPYLIRALLKPGVDQVHYFDADCMVIDSLAPLIADLGAADLLLTPHSLSPIPDDGRTPRALTLLKAGVFNAGYIGVRNTEQGRAFTGWLSAMTLKHARNAPDQGMCGDQRWLDLAPVLFAGTAICRQPGANVAYWNLHERQLTQDAQGRFLVNRQPLIFFHFSGYEPQHPAQLSKHQNRHPLPPDSPLQRLLRTYHSRLAAGGAAAGGGPTRKTPRRLASLRTLFASNPAETKR